MSQTLRALCLFGLILSLSAVSTSPASATEASFHQDSGGSATVNATQVESVKFNGNSGTWNCVTNKSQGILKEATTMQLALVPTYMNCVIYGFIGVPVDVNGCEFLLTSATTTNGTSEATPITHIVCPAGKYIELTIPFECPTKIGPQTIVGNTFANGTSETKKDITITMNFSGVKYDECGINRTNGTWKGKTTVTAKNGSGSAVNLWYE
jgi:hypothetical protein